MKTLTEIIVGPITIPLEYPKVLREKRELGGYEEFPSGKIEVCPGLDVKSAMMTLFHESLHAISAQYGLSLGESKIRVLEMSISALLKDNPEFTKQYLKSL